MTLKRFSATVLSLSRFLHHHLLWFLVAAYAAAAVFPGVGIGIRNLSFGEVTIMGDTIYVSLVMLMLAALMFNAGLGVQPSHLAAVLHKKLVLVSGLVANVAIPTAYIFAVTLIMRFWYDPDEAQHILVGLALVAAMPIAGASTAWAQNSNGNLALSLSLVLASTIVSPIVTPIAFEVFGEMAANEYEEVLHGLAAYGSATFLGLWVVLPVALGLALRSLIPETTLTRILPYLKLVNSIDLLLLNYSNASLSLPGALADGDWDFLAITLLITIGLCLVAFASGYGLSRIFATDHAEQMSLMYGLGMSNNGTALVLASLALASYPRVMVPVIFYNVVQHLVAGTVHEATDKMGPEHRRQYWACVAQTADGIPK